MYTRVVQEKAIFASFALHIILLVHERVFLSICLNYWRRFFKKNIESEWISKHLSNIYLSIALCAFYCSFCAVQQMTLTISVFLLVLSFCFQATMSSPSPSQLAYGQPTGSSLIPFFVGSPGPQGGGAMGASGGLGGPMGSGMGNPRDQGLQQPPQRADVADMERFQQGSNRIGTPTLAGGGASRGQMAVGGSRPIGPHSNNNNNNNNNNSTSQQNSNNQR